MGISELYIVKRDGKRKAFSVEKIKRAVRKAFLSDRKSTRLNSSH